MIRFLFFASIIFIFMILLFDLLKPFFKWVKKISKKLFKLFTKIYINIKNKITAKIEKNKAEKFKNSHEGIMQDWKKKKSNN